MRILKNLIVPLLVTVILITILIYLNGLNRIKQHTYRLRIDTQIDTNESTLLQHIANEMPFLPIEDLNNDNYKNRNLNSSCAWYPSLLDVQIHNDYWQEFHNTNITYYIFGAYLDKRATVVKDTPLIRIVAMMHYMPKDEKDYPPTYCQIWFKEQRQPIIMPALELHRLWRSQWGDNSDHSYGHLLACALPKEHHDGIPRTVSLVSSPCDKATNNVRVVYKPLKENEVKKGFAICFKGLDFPYVDMSHRLVEYVETVRALGAEKIIMYNLQVHPNMTKVLKYYEQTGFIEILPFSFSWDAGNLPEYRHLAMKKSGYYAIKHEVIPYNDCLYRSMYQYEYVANIDIDEILMPMDNLSDWHDLLQFAENLKDANCRKFGSFCLRCVYFPRYPEKPRYSHDIPEYFYMLQHVERVRDHIRPSWATKCFHNTERVLATHNHIAFHVAPGVCQQYSFDAKVAQLQHYREPDIKATLDDPVVDKSLWRFKDEIIERSKKVFEELQFFEEY